MPTTLSDRLHLAALMDAPNTEHPEFVWNPKSRRYQYKRVEGRKGGGFVAKAAFEKLTQDHISRKKAELRVIGEKFADKGGFVQFQKQGWATIKTTFTQQYLLGRGGLGRMEVSDYATIKKELRYQGKMWRGFALDIKAGGMSRAQLQQRLAMYGEASKVAFFDGQSAAAFAAGMREERNVLGVAEHCPDCIELTNKGWQPFGILPRPTKQRRCRIYCYCTMEYRKGLKTDSIRMDKPCGRGFIAESKKCRKTSSQPSLTTRVGIEGIESAIKKWKRAAKTPEAKLRVAIAGDVLRKGQSSPEDVVQVLDQDGRMQAIALHSTFGSIIQIDYLSSAPWNLIEGSPLRMRGAGTKAVQSIIDRGMQRQIEQVQTYSDKGAVDFYKTLGFSIDPAYKSASSPLMKLKLPRFNEATNTQTDALPNPITSEGCERC